ncbi:class I SAM-dependent RNA methyltransferase [Nocardia camponoti]|uniref:23S rRNA methyltransferase n=1 Tax=Nocardia camponoti TaxID=1616106 RepID=A0A917V5U1_9NOCA|nr:class I SAM-dependent RNA methyltransferase [Nocardia camponoti]GGK40880.1 23S rRNA methyltransferase [Nocardia camponoti]
MSDWRGNEFEIRLGDPGHGGFCVGRHEGRVVFVRHGLPGELVRAKVTEDRGGSFCRADAIEIIEPSPDRIPATCVVSGPGGAGCCDFSFAKPEAQRALKAKVVADQLRRIAGVERDIVVEPMPGDVAGPDGGIGGWRSRVRLAVDAAGRAGVHKLRSNEVLPDLRCPQAVDGALDGIADRSWTPGSDLIVAVDSEGTRHIVELAASPDDVRPDTPRGASRGRGQRPGRGRGGRDDRAAVRDHAAARKAATNAPREELLIEGTGRPVEIVADRRWELSPTGFWQAHRRAAQQYSDLVAEWADLKPGATAWDLYSGVGVFAARLAEQVGSTGRVEAVESSRSAVADGKSALADLPWLDLTVDKVERWVNSKAAVVQPDVVVLDPPRAGAGKEVIGAIADADPQRIIHIGCDPASFARDLGLYLDAGYTLAQLRAFDAFPGTHHVECVALLER